MESSLGSPGSTRPAGAFIEMYGSTLWLGQMSRGKREVARDQANRIDCALDPETTIRDLKHKFRMWHDMPRWMPEFDTEPDTQVSVTVSGRGKQVIISREQETIASLLKAEPPGSELFLHIQLTTPASEQEDYS
eukprot:TRINITY_DN9522_c0_g1_i3.p1 TRINITY_DN9522_c0_g1~~TRINITY_DN9522_c0_g1_i3.p1  ORF type:complete len:134 (+),score=10.99 TRINITY_DN9522_c0_g1_i3:198-599(+)